MKNLVILNDIRSVENVGSMFRTADAIGVDKIYLVGYTPAPIDRFGRDRRALAKSALGAQESVAWESRKEIMRLIKRLKEEGYKIFAVEQSVESVDYRKVKTTDKNVFIFGNEVTGVPEKVLSACDQIAEIPMKGEKESLNVAVSFGVALFRIID